MSHGTFKPTRKHLNDALRSKRNGPHEAQAGKHVRRIKILRTLKREARYEQEQY